MKHDLLCDCCDCMGGAKLKLNPRCPKGHPLPLMVHQQALCVACKPARRRAQRVWRMRNRIGSARSTLRA